LVDRLKPPQVGRQSSVDAEDPAADDCGNG
jgi:hypothetical protein